MPERSSGSDSSSKRGALPVRDKPTVSLSKKTSKRSSKPSESSIKSESSSKKDTLPVDDNIAVASSKTGPRKSSAKSQKPKEPKSKFDLPTRRCVLATGHHPADLSSKYVQKKTRKDEPSTDTDPSSKTAVSDDSITSFSGNVPPSVALLAPPSVSRSLRLGKSITRPESKSGSKKKIK
ncbi:hypothetical protein KIN20_009660 [Parelaphostrongylus tenuis]|uniref:Uncharacterized protein n=1 Tax=Parelaphostrongylus tenuis TaxID=148309 RepID=A0AAD5MBH0_PARTN|nr:hypothetical protein KIN20_009660 [Parelaphostrongylus tenuis]